jgi:hypothetical protein
MLQLFISHGNSFSIQKPEQIEVKAETITLKDENES